MKSQHFYARKGTESFEAYFAAFLDNRIIRWQVTDLFGQTRDYKGRVFSAGWVGETNEVVFEVRLEK